MTQRRSPCAVARAAPNFPPAPFAVPWVPSFVGAPGNAWAMPVPLATNRKRAAAGTAGDDPFPAKAMKREKTSSSCPGQRSSRDVGPQDEPGKGPGSDHASTTPHGPRDPGGVRREPAQPRIDAMFRGISGRALGGDSLMDVEPQHIPEKPDCPPGRQAACNVCQGQQGSSHTAPCAFCDRTACHHCSGCCAACERVHCSFCLSANYSGRYERYLCPDCLESVRDAPDSMAL